MRIFAWRDRRNKIPWLSPYAFIASVIILIAIALRVALASKGWPLLDSDEGTMGIMAMHIDKLGERPLFFYGQGYMGATEAYLGAAAFHLFGISSFALRLGLILIFALFLFAMYLLTSLLYSKPLGLLTVALLALGSNAMLVRELAAVGGDPETLMTSALIMLCTAWLTLTSDAAASTRNQWRRLLVYALWGLTAGFSIFSHVLGIPFIGLGGLILLVFCWRELRSLAPLCLLAGLLIGLAPIIYYNLHDVSGKTTLFYVFHAVSAGGTKPDLVAQLQGALLVSLPTATGANPLCTISDATTPRLDSLHAIQCTLVHTGWASGVLVLGAIAVVLALVNLGWLFFRSARRPWGPDERRDCIRNVLRLALLIGATATLVAYVFSPNAMLYPVATSRYLIGMLIATPAILWPLWHGLHAVKPIALKLSARVSFAMQLERTSLILRRSLLGCIGLILLLGTFSTFTGVPAEAVSNPHEDVYFTQNSTQHLDVPAVQALNQQEHALIGELLGMHAMHIYSDYWTCDRLIFQSQERIICSAINDQLGPGHNRYHHYYTTVHADTQAAYVVQVGSQQDSVFSQRIANAIGPWKLYRRQVFAGYAIYRKVT
ncbi:MAG TPA: hypothetical protein VHZ51_00290 [Ktedonobacteraceae bacterium]|jgi:4-amino-4-deoxy-L-arabinose transferase-like glycosyltransferase|nr:hypothetical protein [Ktedonobacteraceae bacterium]